MPKPAEISAEKYQALRARLAEARAAREALEYRLSQSQNRPPFSLALHDLQCAELEALIAAEQGGTAYNRSASDLEALRSFLEAELMAARKVLATPAPVEPAPLASATSDALTAHVEAVLAYQAAHAAYAAAVGPVHTRLALAYAVVGEAQGLVFRARQAAKLYESVPTVPAHKPNDPYRAPPATVEHIDRALELIAAQRVDANPNGVASQAELRLRQLRREREEYELDLAARAEAERFENLPIAEQRLEAERARVAQAAG